jgi:hypothetical protein
VAGVLVDAGEAVEDPVAPLFVLYDPGVLQHRQVLRDSRDVSIHHLVQLADAPLTLRQLLHEEQPRRMGHGLDDPGPGLEPGTRFLIHE